MYPLVQKTVVGTGIFVMSLSVSLAQEAPKNARPVLGEVPQKVEDEYHPEVKGIKAVSYTHLTLPTIYSV